MKKRLKSIFWGLLLLAISLLPKTALAEEEYLEGNSIANVKTAEEFGAYFVNTQKYVNFTFPDPLPQYPSELMIYKSLEKSEPTYDEMKEIGDIFGMGEGCEVYSGIAGSLNYSKKGYSIFFWNTKVFEFCDYTVRDDEGIPLPDEEEGKTFAKSYLQNKGLWHEELEFEGIHYRIRRSIGKIRMTISYLPRLDNGFLKTSAKIEVTIVGGPKVKEVKYFMSEHHSYKTAKIITPEEAINRINQGNCFFWIQSGIFPKETIIDKCYIVYSYQGGSHYIDPIYVFEGSSPEGVPFSIKVSAVESSYLKSDVPAIINIDPDTLNLKSKGKWITCYIELLEGVKGHEIGLENIDTSTILLNDKVLCEPSPIEIGDNDKDGISDLMVKFDRQKVGETLEEGENVPITVTGNIIGNIFKGTDTIKVIGDNKK